ncbi:MAG: mechanosensitive ion channel family protein [Xenococcaceae cyanobacterium]
MVRSAFSIAFLMAFRKLVRKRLRAREAMPKDIACAQKHRSKRAKCLVKSRGCHSPKGRLGNIGTFGTRAVRRIPKWRLGRFRSFGAFICSLLAFTLITTLVPIALGQETVSNLVHAPVKLDGEILFQVASPLAISQDKGQERSSIELRVKNIENVLEEIIQKGDPQTLEVKVGIFNRQTVIFAFDREQWQKLAIATVTELDAQLYGIPVPDLAQQRANNIYKALIKAWRERELEFLMRQGLIALGLALGMILASGLLLFLHKRAIAQWRILKEQLSTQAKSATTNSQLESHIEEFFTQRWKFLFTKQQQLTLKQRLNRNILMRRLLQFGLFLIWSLGTLFILRLFPYTREVGVWLFGKPISLLGIWLVMILANKGSDFLIDWSLKTWAEEPSLPQTTSQRRYLRVSTFAVVFKAITAVVLLCLNIFLSLRVLNIPVSPMLAGAGILGLAISLGSRRLIEDVIAGFLILWIDTYAVGDVIVFGNVGGLVENLTLIHTQLRDLEGRLITIPHSEIRMVQNLSKDWSQVNFTFKVGYDTDVERAMRVLRQVAQQIYGDPQWQEQIVELPRLLGVEELAQSGIVIRLWIKTQPLQQWAVAREFRRRLKAAFDREGIPIGVPHPLDVRNFVF